MGRNYDHQSIGAADSYLLQCVDTVAVGKHEVEQHKLILVDNLNAGPHAGARVHIITKRFKRFPYHPDYALVIIYDQ